MPPDMSNRVAIRIMRFVSKFPVDEQREVLNKISDISSAMYFDVTHDDADEQCEREVAFIGHPSVEPDIDSED